MSKAGLVALTLGFATALLFYGAHPAFSDWHLRYGAIHYLKMWFPVLTMIGTLGLVEVGQTVSRKVKLFTRT